MIYYNKEYKGNFVKSGRRMEVSNKDFINKLKTQKNKGWSTNVVGYYENDIEDSGKRLYVSGGEYTFTNNDDEKRKLSRQIMALNGGEGIGYKKGVFDEIINSSRKPVKSGVNKRRNIKSGYSNNPDYFGDWFGKGQIDFSKIINPEDDGNVWMVKMWSGSGYVLDVYLCKANDVYEAIDTVFNWSWENEGENNMVFDLDYVYREADEYFESDPYMFSVMNRDEPNREDFIDRFIEEYYVSDSNYELFARSENFFVDKVPAEYLTNSRKPVKSSLENDVSDLKNKMESMSGEDIEKGIKKTIRRNEKPMLGIKYNVLDQNGGVVGTPMSYEDACDLADDIDGEVVPVYSSRKAIKSEKMPYIDDEDIDKFEERLNKGEEVKMKGWTFRKDDTGRISVIDPDGNLLDKDFKSVASFIDWFRYWKKDSLKSSRQIKSAVDGGWEVRSSDVPEALDLFVEYNGEEIALEEIARAMGTDTLEDNIEWIAQQWGFGEELEDIEDVWDKYEYAKEVMGVSELFNNLTQAAGYDELAEDLAFIFRQYDFREWDKYDDEIESSRRFVKSVRDTRTGEEDYETKWEYVDELCDRAIKAMDGDKDAMFFNSALNENGFIIKGRYIDSMEENGDYSNPNDLWADICKSLAMDKLLRITKATERKDYQLVVDWVGEGLMNGFVKSSHRFNDSKIGNDIGYYGGLYSVVGRDSENQYVIYTMGNDVFYLTKDNVIIDVIESRSTAEAADELKEWANRYNISISSMFPQYSSRKVVKSSKQPITNKVAFYKDVVKKILSNRMTTDEALDEVCDLENCNKSYATTVLQNWIDKYQDKLIKSDAEIADIQKDFNVDGDLNSWAEDYMPGSGTANTKGGELVRAAQRILTEYYNNGNMIGRGYGNETANPAARYIVEKTTYDGNDEIEDMLNHVVYMTDEEYDAWCKRFEEDFANYLRDKAELFSEPNDDDMNDYKDDDDKEFFLNKFYIEDDIGNRYMFIEKDSEYVCDDVEFAKEQLYSDGDVIEENDELVSEIDKTEDYGTIEKYGFMYDWEAMGEVGEDGNYKKWKIVRVTVGDQMFETGDALDLSELENYRLFDVNGNEVKEEDFLKL